MNWNIVEGKWKQFKGLIKGQWGRLTGDPVDEMAGKGDQLAGKVQETYGSVQDKVEKTVSQVEEGDKK
ncbi:MAG: CsbD family protein [Sedimenticolaceae bacterium]